ncbi:MAG TPA: alanine racemase [Candidatus Paceibacterota bacterium]|nr:alanine racemase [Candidatus Paceibacterota bacterium]
MEFIDTLRNIKRRFSPHRPLVEVGISKANLLHNLRTYQARYQNVRIAPVLKSNAYGHDLGLIARLLDKEDIAFFMVDSFYEARKLRAAGVKGRIVVMGYVRPTDPERSRLRDVDFALTDIEQLREISALLTRENRFHLKLDTGMHRQGILPADLPAAIELIKKNPNIKLVGIASHFADADGEDDAFSQAQVETWNEGVAEVERSFATIEYRHIAATKGIRFGEATRTNVARVGIGLYGFDTSPEGTTDVRPVLELRSLITSIREIPAGDHVGYNITYTAKRPSRIATVPVGYYEGCDRRLSNKGAMLVQGAAAALIGRVSMNMSSIDVTDIPAAKVGDPVIVISRDPSAPNSIDAIVERISTPEYRESEYVMLVHIPPHLRRVVE